MTADRTAPAPLAANTRVVYAGSQAEHHGPATVVCRCYCRYCPWDEATDVRYEIETEGGRVLLHVHPESLTVEDGGVAR